MSRYLLYLFCSLLIIPSAMAGSPAANPDFEQRLQKLEKSMGSSGLLDLFQQIEHLRRQVNELQGELEVHTFKMKKLEQRNEKVLRDIYARLEQLEANSEPLSANANTEDENNIETDTLDGFETANDSERTADGDAETTPEFAAEEEAQAKTAYQAAFALLKDSYYLEASEAFARYLTDYPRSKYADNAQYWLAESYFVQRDFNNAITAYQGLIDDYPDSRKLANGTLKLAYSYQELEQIEEAKRYLQQVIDLFPGSSAAQDASSRLRSLSADESAQE